jgi:hypothetical protein
MKKILILASLAALTLTSVAAQAEHNWRKRKFVPLHDRTIYLDQYEDDGFVAYEDDEDDEDVIYLNRRKRMMREAEEEVEAELWWLEEGARKKLDARKTPRKVVSKKAEVKPAVKKPVTKTKPVVAAKPAPAKVQTASLSKPVTVAKPKPVVAVTKSNPAATKSIGCTAGAAVVTGYGFGDVKPKACTGQTYAYTAARAGKIYEIKMTAASGEIIDVKKLN